VAHNSLHTRGNFVNTEYHVISVPSCMTNAGDIITHTYIHKYLANTYSPFVKGPNKLLSTDISNHIT